MTFRTSYRTGLSRRPQAEADLRISFEFFPPANPRLEEQFEATAQRLARLSPDFVSVTYGAGGSTKDRTLSTLEKLVGRGDLSVAGHLTCADASRDAVDAVVRDYHRIGIRHIVALRGDPSGGVGARYAPHPEGYANGAHLVAGIAAFGGFEITVAAYPEKHPESPDFATDIDMLKRKVDNGATRAITQFFFDNDMFESYVERVRQAGIYVPIIPGILPIHDFKKMSNFAMRCGTHVPAWLAERFEGLEDDPQTAALVAAAIAAEQVTDLRERGFEDFHFYTMNRADLSYAICHLLGMRPGNRPNGETHLAAA